MLWLGTDNWGAILLVDDKEYEENENCEEKDGDNETYDLTKEEDYAVDQSTGNIEETEKQSERERLSANFRHENLTETLVKSPEKKNNFKKQSDDKDSDDKYDEFAFLDNLLDGKQDKKSKNKEKKDEKNQKKSKWRYDDEYGGSDEDEDEEDEDEEDEDRENDEEEKNYDEDNHEQKLEKNGDEILQVRKQLISLRKYICFFHLTYSISFLTL